MGLTGKSNKPALVKKHVSKVKLGSRDGTWCTEDDVATFVTLSDIDGKRESIHLWR